MIPLAEAREHVLSRCHPRGPVPVPLIDAAGCVLAGPVVAPEAVPPWDNSAMDGFAVRAADVAGASEDRPVTLPVVATVAAGAAATTEVGPGQAVRIMTGAPMPPGADAVVMVEATRGGPDATEIEILASVEPGRNIRSAGSDITAGEQVIDGGTLLGPAHLGVLASVNVRRPVVIRRPRLGVISTGDELIDDDRPLAPGQIRESNRPMLVALARSFGIDAVDLGTVADDRDALATALRDAAATCDAVATSGGVSMGDFDLVKVVLGELADMRWMQIAIRPAKPFAFGMLDGTPVFGLPGNPVSSMVSLSLLGVPGLRRLAGRSDLDLPRVTATSAVELSGAGPRDVYLRVACTWDGPGLRAAPVPAQASHHLSATADANGLALIPAGTTVAPGDQVTVVLLSAPT
ncbi:gephyrin-like molybdotransferase Glp [Aquihabitans sp. McL0605]|uniref:molybdopterin molybdotransferase MoeA n=1 Tax=Aquihabitans sp. McL0605 TaxID=3415671 RepID=UPI003CF2B893